MFKLLMMTFFVISTGLYDVPRDPCIAEVWVQVQEGHVKSGGLEFFGDLG